jgi:DNA topoisomerase I
MSKVIIVDSIGKAKTIQAILGSSWQVVPVLGWVRRLADDGSDKLGFFIHDRRVKCRYTIENLEKSNLDRLRAMLDKTSEVYLASDPDRNGELIAWHLAEVLQIEQPKRLVCLEITPEAIDTAIANPRPIDYHMVAATQTHQCLDRSIEHFVTPIVRGLGAKKVRRVELAALHWICDREREIGQFEADNCWVGMARYQNGLCATLLASGNGRIISSQIEADRIFDVARAHQHKLVKIDRETEVLSPPLPFNTSTLQAAAATRLKLSPDVTMAAAQRLYEAGLITYMHTSSDSLSARFSAQVCGWLINNNENNIISVEPREDRTREDRDEAIRPTDIELQSKDLEAIDPQVSAVYQLIWQRTVASLCKPAELYKTTFVTQSGEIYWEAIVRDIGFAGYTKYWMDVDILYKLSIPAISEGDFLETVNLGVERRSTIPQPRYSAADLASLMCRFGVGCPSTYVETISALQDREYIVNIEGMLMPTNLGMDVDRFLLANLPDLVDPEWTAKIDRELNQIAKGTIDGEEYLNRWNQEYLTPALAAAAGQRGSTKSGKLLSCCRSVNRRER